MDARRSDYVGDGNGLRLWLVGVDAGGRRQWHPVQRAYSFCASNDPRTHVGLGAATRVDSVEVRWPDGRREAFGSFAAGAVHELREGAGVAASGT